MTVVPLLSTVLVFCWVLGGSERVLAAGGIGLLLLGDCWPFLLGVGVLEITSEPG